MEGLSFDSSECYWCDGGRYMCFAYRLPWVMRRDSVAKFFGGQRIKVDGQDGWKIVGVEMNMSNSMYIEEGVNIGLKVDKV
jgi:hypothetical protein